MKQTEIIPINVLGNQEFMGIEIPVIEGGFGEGKKAITDKHIAQIHGMTTFNVRKRISDNINRFKERVDLIDLKVIYQINNNLDLLLSLGYSKMEISKAEHLYLLSERGYAKLIKIMDTDLAWEIHDKLIDEYFAMKQFIKQLSKEDIAWLDLKHAEQDENAQYLINYYRRKDKEQFERILIHERDGEDKRATLEEIANVLSKELGIKVASNDITDFLTYKGYFRLQYFQSMSGGKLRYYGDGSPRMESRPHKQPTGNFIQDLCKQGYAVNKKPDSRGKVTVVYFKGFTKWFLDGHSKEFSKYMRYNKKGFEVWEE